MFEHAERCNEVVELARPSRCHRRRADHHPPVGRRRTKIDEERLNVGAPIDKHDIFARQIAELILGKRRLEPFAVLLLDRCRHLQTARDVAGKHGAQQQRPMWIDHARCVRGRDGGGCDIDRRRGHVLLRPCTKSETERQRE